MKKFIIPLIFFLACNSQASDSTETGSPDTIRLPVPKLPPLAERNLVLSKDTVLSNIQIAFSDLYESAYRGDIMPIPLPPAGFSSWYEYAKYAEKIFLKKGYFCSIDTATKTKKGETAVSICVARIIKHTKESNPEIACQFWNHAFEKKYDIYYCKDPTIFPLDIWANLKAAKERKKDQDLTAGGFTLPKEGCILLFNRPDDFSERALRNKLNEFGNIIFDKEIRLPKDSFLTINLRVRETQIIFEINALQTSELVSSLNESVAVTDFKDFIHHILETELKQYEGQITFFKTIAAEYLRPKGFYVLKFNLTNEQIGHKIMERADNRELGILVKEAVFTARNLIVKE